MSKEQGAKNKDGSVEYLPTARFFDPANRAHRAAQNDTLFGVKYLPASKFFAPTVQTRSGSREMFFDPANPAQRAAQNDTLFQSEKEKVKRQKGVEYLPATRFFDPANPAHRAAQNDTLFGPLLEKIRHIYTAEIGIREKTNKNDGTRIEDYLAYVGLGKGNPWCAAFICWVYGKAGVVNPKSGWSPTLFPESRIIWLRSRGLIQHSSFSIQNTSSISTNSIKHSSLNIQNSEGHPRAADIFGIWFQDKKRIAHCGFIDDWQDKYVITVEGNTNDSGSREGDGVYRKRRLISTVYKVARWVG